MAKFDEKTELKKLEKIVAQMSEDRKKLAEGLVQNAAFMISQLVTLQDIIREYGVVENYQHGANQSGTKQSVAMGTYLQLQKSYGVTIRALESFLPKQGSSRNSHDDELLEFLNNR